MLETDQISSQRRIEKMDFNDIVKKKLSLPAPAKLSSLSSTVKSATSIVSRIVANVHIRRPKTSNSSYPSSNPSPWYLLTCTRERLQCASILNLRGILFLCFMMNPSRHKLIMVANNSIIQAHRHAPRSSYVPIHSTTLSRNCEKLSKPNKSWATARVHHRCIKCYQIDKSIQTTDDCVSCRRFRSI